MGEDDDFNMDLGLEPEEAAEAASKGTKSGLKKGIQKGSEKGIQPIAEKIAEQVAANIAGGGTGNSPIDKTLEQMGKMSQVEMMKELVEDMKTKRDAKRNPPQTQAPTDDFAALMDKCASMGMDIKDLGLSKRELLTVMNNPKMLPFVLMMHDDGDERGGRSKGGNDMSWLPLIMSMNKPDHPAPVSPPQNNDSIIAVLLKQIEMLEKRMERADADVRRESDEKWAARMEGLKPYMEHRSFADELAEIEEKQETLKKLGFGQRGPPQSSRAEELQFKADEYALDIRKQELLDERLEKQKDRELRQKEKDMKLLGQGVAMAKSFFKQIPLGPKPEDPEQPPTRQPQKPPPTPPVTDLLTRRFTTGDTKPSPTPEVFDEPQQAPVGKRISDRVTQMLRRMQDAIPEGEGQEPSEE